MKAIVQTSIKTTLDMDGFQVVSHELHIECDDELPEEIVLAISQGALASGLKKVHETRTSQPLEEAIHEAMHEEFGDEDDASRVTEVLEKFL